MITQKQVEVLKVIADYIDKKGYGPCIREISESANLSTSHSVHKYIDTLEKLGCIRIKELSRGTISVTREGMQLLKLLG